MLQRLKVRERRNESPKKLGMATAGIWRNADGARIAIREPGVDPRASGVHGAAPSWRVKGGDLHCCPFVCYSSITISLKTSFHK